MSRRLAIVSGYFNPTHVGHLRMMEAARAQADGLVVIVNNDTQQVLKKGRVILGEQDRVRLVCALKVVDDVILSVDEDPTVTKSLALIRSLYPSAELIFCNGGDRNSTDEIPESQVCRDNDIELRFGVGGDFKTDSSTRLIAAMEAS